MKPKVYLYKETVDGVTLYLGECSTLDGLSLFNEEAQIQLISFGATCYKKYVWATENELPKFDKVKNIVAFLKSEGDIGVVEFNAKLPGIGEFGSHDDGECHFHLESKKSAIEMLKKVLPEQYSDMLINQLVDNQGFYITCDDKGVVSKFGSFDDYLATNV
ncbi:hypothetical protein [Aliikangiella maris]